MDSLSYCSFFESKSKNKQKTAKFGHSRSLSANTNLTKNSARFNGPTYFTPLTKKQKQIRQAIQLRYQKSKIRKYVYDPIRNKSARRTEKSRSSQMKQYQNLKHLKYINLKQYHGKKSQSKPAKSKKQLRNSTDCVNKIKDRMRIKGNASVIIKTEASEKSVSKLIRIEQKGKKTKRKQLQIKSHRTLTITQKSKSKSKIGQRKQKQYDFVPKLYNLSRIHQKFKF